jgi:hypothetical protein
MDASCMGWWSNPIQFQSDYNLTDVMAREIDRTWWPETSMNGHTTYCVRTRRTYIPWPPPPATAKQTENETRENRWMDWSMCVPAAACARVPSIDRPRFPSVLERIDRSNDHLSAWSARSIAPSPFRHVPVGWESIQWSYILNALMIPFFKI